MRASAKSSKTAASNTSCRCYWQIISWQIVKTEITSNYRSCTGKHLRCKTWPNWSDIFVPVIPQCAKADEAVGFRFHWSFGDFWGCNTWWYRGQTTCQAALVKFSWYTVNCNCTIVITLHTNVRIMSFGRVVEYRNWRWILKWLFTFLFSDGSKSKTNCSASFWWNSPTFSKSWRCSKIHFTTTLKNTTTIIFQYSTPISTSNALSKWHDSHLTEIPFWAGKIRASGTSFMSLNWRLVWGNSIDGCNQNFIWGSGHSKRMEII